MENTVVLAVLFGAMLHAGWNTLVKSSGDKEADLALVHFMGAVVALPLLGLVGLPPPAAWPYVALSVAIHMAYYVTLDGAYRHGELGLTYPIMRGSAPMLVALGSGVVLGETLGAGHWAGILAITGGVALVGLSHLGEALHHRRALAYAFANATVIACYTFVDGSGVRSTVEAGHGAAAYVMLLFVLDGIPYPAFVLLRRSADRRRALLDYARRRWPLATLGGAASIGSYAIALWAMTRAPVAAVAALRETSVLFAALFGAAVLKERLRGRRIFGTLAILGGVAALRLA